MATTELQKTEGRQGLKRRFESQLDDIWEDLQQLWDSPFAWPTRLLPATVRPKRRLPSVDVFEKDGQLVIQAELPGLKKEEIEVAVEDQSLVIRGERKEESRVEKEDYFHMERATGSFYRRLPLPPDVKSEDVKAEFKDGVLEIRLPKPALEQVKAQRIPVS